MNHDWLKPSMEVSNSLSEISFGIDIDEDTKHMINRTREETWFGASGKGLHCYRKESQDKKSPLFWMMCLSATPAAAICWRRETLQRAEDAKHEDGRYLSLGSIFLPLNQINPTYNVPLLPDFCYVDWNIRKYRMRVPRGRNLGFTHLGRSCLLTKLQTNRSGTLCPVS